MWEKPWVERIWRNVRTILENHLSQKLATCCQDVSSIILQEIPHMLPIVSIFAREGWTRGSTCASGFDFIHDRFLRLSPRVTVHFLAEVLTTLSFGCLYGNLKLFFLLFIASC